MVTEATRLDDDMRWRAVIARDADVSFVYAVRTTGVFCWPSCAARKPQRRNVAYFGSPLAAEVAGYRACRRCRPGVEAADPNVVAVRRACELINAADTEPDLAELGRHVGYSPAHLQRVFSATLGLSPKQYAAALRRRRLHEALAGAPSVTDAILRAGYGSMSRGYAAARQSGLSPSSHLAGGAGEMIRYAHVASTLGPMVVAASDHGVCAIEFADPDEAVRTLRRRLPHAHLCSDADGLAGLAARVLAYIDEPASARALPLDIRGTAFQQRVWRALTAIPVGHTASYGTIAERIGRPGAARAVAAACASNPLAVVVPCHRVVRADGVPGGYRWGEERKRALLDREAAADAAGSGE